MEEGSAVIDKIFGDVTGSLIVTPGMDLVSKIEHSAELFKRRDDAMKVRLGQGITPTLTASRLGHFCEQRGRRFWLHSRINYVS